MLLKVFLNLLVAPILVSLLPSTLFWYFEIGNLELYKWFIVFIAVYWYKETKITF